MENDVVNLCKDLVSIESFSGNEGGVAAYLQGLFKSNGIDDVLVDRYGNVIVHIKGNRPGLKFLFDCHMDTVPYDKSKWSFNPLGEIADGKLYGRGTSDMKGALSAFTCAAINFSLDRDFAGDIYLGYVVHEECFEGIGSASICDIVKPDVVMIGEASEFNLKVGQRGRAEIKVEVFGKACHSASPEKGINAVYKMNKVITAINELECSEHPVLGKGIMELTDIKSAPYPGASVVPDYCVATYDRRLLVGEDRESVLKPYIDLADKLMADDNELNIKVSYAIGSEVCYTGNMIEGERFFPGWLFENNERVLSIQSDLIAGGFNPSITKYNFCTNGSLYAGDRGIFTFGLGPSLETLAHVVDEYITIEDLENIYDCYLIVLNNLMK